MDLPEGPDGGSAGGEARSGGAAGGVQAGGITAGGVGGGSSAGGSSAGGSTAGGATAGGSAGGASGGTAGGASANVDGGPVELRPASGDVTAIALLSLGARGFLLAWAGGAAGVPKTLFVTQLDLAGQRVGTDQLITTAPNGWAPISLTAGALRVQPNGSVNLTVSIGDEVQSWNLNPVGRSGQQNFRLTTPHAWAIEYQGGAFVRTSSGESLIVGVPPYRIPPSHFARAAVPSTSASELTILSTGSSGEIGVETLAIGSWSWSQIATSPMTSFGTPGLVEPLGLFGQAPSFVAAWSEQNPGNPRQMDLRVMRSGSPSRLVQANAAWNRIDAALTNSAGPGGWVIAWTGIGGGWNPEILFAREGRLPCRINEPQTSDVSSGPVAIAEGLAARVAVAWAEPPAGPRQPGVRLARLMVRVLSPSECAAP
jgi:hypothetical protein